MSTALILVLVRFRRACYVDPADDGLGRAVFSFGDMVSVASCIAGHHLVKDVPDLLLDL